MKRGVSQKSLVTESAWWGGFFVFFRRTTSLYYIKRHRSVASAVTKSAGIVWSFVRAWAVVLPIAPPIRPDLPSNLTAKRVPHLVNHDCTLPIIK